MSNCFKRVCSPAVLIADLKSPLFWRDVVVEGIATTILVTCIMMVVITNHVEAYKPNTLHIGIAAAFIIFMIVEAFGPLCGAHLNPAVSIPLFIGGRITFTRAMAYSIIQILAGLLGAMIGVMFTPGPSRLQFRPMLPAPTMTLSQAIMVEAFLTFLLLFTVMSITDPTIHPVPHLPGLVLGATVALGALLGGTHSGGVLNPVVALAPAFITGHFRGYIIYWIGPMLGGTIGVLLYNLIQFIKFKFSPKPAEPVVLSAKAEEVQLLARKDELVQLLEEILNRPIVPIKTSDI